MNILVYKRTHTGDPSPGGCFGVHDCMGAIRDRGFDAVIGVGGMGLEAMANGIAGQVNWIGIGPHKTHAHGKRGPEVTFDHFLDFGDGGPSFEQMAPALAKRMYGHNVRSVMQGLTEVEQGEAERILAMAKNAPPSAARGKAVQTRVTRSRCKRRSRKSSNESGNCSERC
ncbi:MAG: hypothetical protein R3C18_04525 [Planctomycetaceae bacterium]